MGFVPPPLELTPEEFKRRWEAGARSMRELDPAFCEWFEQGERDRKRILIAIGMAIGALIVVLILKLFLI